MQDNKLSKRLLWIAERVREGTVLYDVGTDHAKLPVYLLDNGRISRAVASDIHKGPLEKTKAFLSLCGHSDRIDLVLADGLCGIDLVSPSDVSVCGMGGETIVNILAAKDEVKDKNIRLLLQPMTDFACLRTFLCENGFAIIDEDVVFSDNREYQCIVAEYTGERYALTDVEKELGAGCIEKHSDVFLKYLDKKIRSLNVCIDGKKRASLDVSFEEEMLREYFKILEG